MWLSKTGSRALFQHGQYFHQELTNKGHPEFVAVVVTLKIRILVSLLEGEFLGKVIVVDHFF